MTRRLAPLAALALLATACTGEGGTVTTTGPGPTATIATTATTTGPPITLLEVFDGDTVLVSIEGVEEEVRLLGINAPERDECFGAQAREAAATLLAVGPLRLDIETERDQFGRLLAYAHAGETLLNLALVEDGFALALQDDHPRLAEFLQAGERAFAGGFGLWAADACGTPSSAPVTLVDVEFDPPGPDEDDLNGEWVLLGNLADQDADLTGWMLRDESSEHRYRFRPGTLLRPGEQVAVHTGCGNDAPGDLYWCQDGPVWNNGGDTALLLDPAGNVAGRLRYID
ncbi:MAG: lamin tail domain-containing protein [Actinomycetota bacterium]